MEYNHNEHIQSYDQEGSRKSPPSGMNLGKVQDRRATASHSLRFDLYDKSMNRVLWTPVLVSALRNFRS